MVITNDIATPIGIFFSKLQAYNHGLNTPNELNHLYWEYSGLLYTVFAEPDLAETNHQCHLSHRLAASQLYRMILYARDRRHGLNNFHLANMLLGAWVSLHLTGPYKSITEKLGFMALQSFVYPMTKKSAGDSSGSGYGQWKDLKYFCNYLSNHFYITQDISKLSIFNYAVHLLLNKMAEVEGDAKVEGLGRWLPREKSPVFGWLAQYLAVNYYRDWMDSAGTNRYTLLKARRKCLTHYRKFVVSTSQAAPVPVPVPVPVTTYANPLEVLNHYRWAHDELILHWRIMAPSEGENEAEDDKKIEEFIVVDAEKSSGYNWFGWLGWN